VRLCAFCFQHFDSENAAEPAAQRMQAERRLLEATMRDTIDLLSGSGSGSGAHKSPRTPRAAGDAAAPQLHASLGSRTSVERGAGAAATLPTARRTGAGAGAADALSATAPAGRARERASVSVPRLTLVTSDGATRDAALPSARYPASARGGAVLAPSNQQTAAVAPAQTAQTARAAAPGRKGGALRVRSVDDSCFDDEQDEDAAGGAAHGRGACAGAHGRTLAAVLQAELARATDAERRRLATAATAAGVRTSALFPLVARVRGAATAR
jgi:hypothetical protein